MIISEDRESFQSANNYTSRFEIWKKNVLQAELEPEPRTEENAYNNSNPILNLRTALLGCILAMLLAVAVVFVIIKTRRRKASSPLIADPSKQPSLVFPSLIVDLRPIQQQPEQPLPYLQAPVVSTDANVFRKPKRLLERRGSNASLTIELNPSDTLSYTASDKECSTEEDFLSSAGNKRTRHELREIANDKTALRKEFLEIPLYYTTKLEITGAVNKNRYRSIFPNSRTRVLLSEEPNDVCSTYINANYIRGYDGEPKAFIATQGPLPNTINDFWKMVWFEHATAIVMLTKLTEKNKVKCEQYLPAKTDVYGSISVTIEKLTIKDGYYVRVLTLENMSTHEKQTLKHYWFKSWPDHKAPLSTASHLLDLVEEVESERLRRSETLGRHGPVVVHCSAGIGRTGCYIATSIAMRQLKQKNTVDMLGIVCQMRIDRGGMLTSPEQYHFVHHALTLYEKGLPDESSTIKKDASDTNSCSIEQR